MTFLPEDFGFMETSVYLIAGTANLFIVDTHLGPDPVFRAIALLTSNLKSGEIGRPGQDGDNLPAGDGSQASIDGMKRVIFNTHSDYDHVWGNCACPDGIVISHEICRRTMAESGNFILRRLREQAVGDFELVLPELTFTDRLNFADEGVSFVHTPGHSADSASCIDTVDRIIFAGDLLESPIPCLGWHRLDEYLRTLDWLLGMSETHTILSSHSGEADRRLIEANAEYVKSVSEGRACVVPAEAEAAHQGNLKNLVMSRWEDTWRMKLGDLFDPIHFLTFAEGLFSGSPETMERAMERYRPAAKIEIGKV